MTLAITIMAVTASICASTSEAARLVASFMPYLLEMGMTRRRARAPATVRLYSERPSTIFAFDESPLSKYRRRRIE
jgi:hypothetical protein